MKSIFFFLFTITATCAISQPDHYWDRKGDSIGGGPYSGTFADEQGNIYHVAGAFGSAISFQLLKYDQSGGLLWEQRDSNTTKPMHACLDDTGNVYVTGAIENSRDAYVSKYASSGALLWKKTYNGTGDSTDISYAITLLNSEIYICGSTIDSFQQQRIFVNKYDLAGNLVWTFTDSLGHANRDLPYYITHDSQNILVTGMANNDFFYRDFFLMKVTPSGNKVWSVIDGFGVRQPTGRKIAVDGNDDIYVILSSTHSLPSLVKYDSNGGFLWGHVPVHSTPNAPSNYNEIKTDASNHVYISGSATIGGGIEGLPAFSFTKLTSAGTVVFDYIGPVQGNAGSFDFLSADDVIITGQLDSVGFRMLDFDSAGNIKWSHFYTDDVSDAVCNNIVIDTMKNIVLGGYYNSLAVGIGAQVIKYGDITGIPLLNTRAIGIYPNPTADVICIEDPGFQPSDHHKVRITNALGQNIFESSITGRKFFVDLQTLAGQGTYFISILNQQNQTVEFRKVVVL